MHIVTLFFKNVVFMMSDDNFNTGTIYILSPHILALSLHKLCSDNPIFYVLQQLNKELTFKTFLNVVIVFQACMKFQELLRLTTLEKDH